MRRGICVLPWFVSSAALAGEAAAQSTDSVPPPTRLWAAQTAIGQVTLVWKLAPGATGYVLYRDVGEGESAEGQPKLATLGANVSRYVYVVRGAPKQVQEFHLEAMDASGRVSPKVAFNPVTPVTTAVAASPPPSVTAKESSPGVITVTWTQTPGASAYVLGRSAGTGGLASLCAICPTEPTYVDSGVTKGMRYQYSVAAITPTAVSTRTMSNVLTPGVLATTGGGSNTSGGTTGGTPGGTSNPGTTTTDTTKPRVDPLQGRYRVSITGFTVTSQTYDHLLGIDGKGDEVWLATHVLQLDTTSTSLVVANKVQTSGVFGDVNGFSYRMKAGTAGSTGGLVTGNVFPSPKGLIGTGGFPLVVWDGTLVQGRSAVMIIPTIWEWDDNPELFGNWLTGRHSFLARLLQPDRVAMILLNQSLDPVEMGSPGLYVHTNMYADPRDRPIGLKPAQPAPGAGFFGPLEQVYGPKYGTMSDSVVTTILPSNPFASFARALLEKLFKLLHLFPGSLGTTNANMPLASGQTAPGVLAQLVGTLREQLPGAMARLPSGQGIKQLAGGIQSAIPSSLSSNLYLFEKTVGVTPAAVQAALGAAKTTGAVSIDVPYVDYSSLKGKYTLHLRVERIQ